MPSMEDWRLAAQAEDSILNAHGPLSISKGRAMVWCTDTSTDTFHL